MVIDKGEETSDSTVSLPNETELKARTYPFQLKPFVEDFLNRINNFKDHSASDSLLQRHTDAVMLGFRNADLVAGNAGKEVIDMMSKSFRYMRPKMQFRSLRQYLQFRHDNVGAK